MNRPDRLAVLCLFALMAACSSGGSDSCGFDGATTLAASAWPKFRRDVANTGRTEASLSSSRGEGRRLFPPEGVQIGSLAATPILGSDRIYLGSTDGNLYVLDFDGKVVIDSAVTDFGAITASPLLGEDGTVFVAAADGTLTKVLPDGTERWTTSIGGVLTSSPTIGADGTVYVGSLAGVFGGVCPNGVGRFSIGVTPVESAPAIAPDPENDDPDAPLILFATESGQVRAVDRKGRERWSFFPSNPVSAAVVLDLPAGRFYVADASGRVTSASVSDGEPDVGFRFSADFAVSASPALGRDDATIPTLYVADEGGRLYAVDRESGQIRWTFEADGPIRSSPAVATGGAADAIVFGADDGRVYAVEDAGDAPVLLWTFDARAPVGSSSPAIGDDGTVYIGTEAGASGAVLYAIGAS